MLKRVLLKNFESHEDSVVEFTDGLNLLIGQSNQGKSSIVRAIAMVVANRFDKDCVRTGKDFCEVTLETDRGSVTAMRGEAMNQWRVRTPDGKEKTYRSIGTGVPPEAMSILGMGERRRGEMSELPNIMFQLEKHYMLAEVDGKKVTANMIARMMDEAIGIGGMEELIKDIASDFEKAKRGLGTSSTEVSELKSQMMDEAAYRDIEEGVEEMQALHSKVEESRGLLDGVESVVKDISRLKEGISRMGAELSLLDGLEGEMKSLEGRDSLLSLLERAVEMEHRLSRIEKRLEGTSDIEGLYSRIEGRREVSSLCSRAVEAKRKLEVIEASMLFPDFSSEIGSLSESLSAISEARESLENAREQYRSISRMKRSIQNTEASLSEREGEFDALCKSFGKCPLCGRELEDGGHEH